MMAWLRVRRDAQVKYNVWDPNHVNPYGEEMVLLVDAAGFDVAFWRPRGSGAVPNSRTVAWLARSRATDGRFVNVILRLCVPIVFIVWSMITRRVVWLIWTRGLYEAALFALCAMVWPVVFTHHNPVANRIGNRLQRHVVASLLRSAECVVIHSKHYIQEVSMQNSATVALPHPPYTAWVDRHVVSRREICVDEPPLRTALYVGQIRADKGAHDMPAILCGFAEHNIPLQIVSFGDGALALSEQYSHLANIAFFVQREPLDDEVVARALASSDLLIAPYANATQSGTINLAFTAGVDTIAYESGALSEMLTSDSLTSAHPTSLVERVIRWRKERWDTYKQSPDNVKCACIDGVREVGALIAR